jgi:glyceraldehyde-3-phosphate dehydrogenase (NADP+)
VNLKLWINGEWQTSTEQREIRSPYTGETVALCAQAGPEQMTAALNAAVAAGQAYGRSPRFERARLLTAMAEGLARRRADLVERMILEAGKPRQLADVEVSRAILTFTNAAEEAKRWGGEIIPLDTDPSGAQYLPALSMWKPRGPVLAIAPFNFPLNLIAHKVAPALAAGCAVIVKPPPQDPGCAVILAEIFTEAAKGSDVPLPVLQIVHAANEVIAPALGDRRITTLSFTGSERAGWHLQSLSSGKKVILELGGNAGVIVHHDADLERAARRCAFGAYAYAGQVCISVQRVFVHRQVAEEFQRRLLEEIGRLRCGDPADAAVAVGPVIDTANADRLMLWIEEARAQGARLLSGGERTGNLIRPVLLANVPASARVACEEVFGPVAVIETYESEAEALAKINASRFGLQAGLFTRDQRFIHAAFNELEVGAVIINDIPTYRADHMPYGGVKESGLGREGVRYAMESYSERRTLVEWRSF